MTQESKPDVRGGVVDAAKREIETLLEKHLDDVSALIAGFVAAQTSPPSVSLLAIVDISGSGWCADQAQGDDVSAFLRAHAGQRIRVRYEAVADEPHDTERPPPMFSPEEAGTFEPVTITSDEARAFAPELGKMVGPERVEQARANYPDLSEQALEAIARMTPEEKARFVNGGCAILDPKEPIYGVIGPGMTVKT